MPVHFVSGRSLKVKRLLREQDQAGALPAALTISRDANTGVSQDFTALTAAVQLRLRVAVFADCHQGCKHCSDAAPKAFGAEHGAALWRPTISPMWLSSDSSSFVNCRAQCPTRVRVSPSAPFPH